MPREQSTTVVAPRETTFCVTGPSKSAEVLTVIVLLLIVGKVEIPVELIFLTVDILPVIDALLDTDILDIVTSDANKLPLNVTSLELYGYENTT